MLHQCCTVVLSLGRRLPQQYFVMTLLTPPGDGCRVSMLSEGRKAMWNTGVRFRGESTRQQETQSGAQWVTLSSQPRTDTDQLRHGHALSILHRHIHSGLSFLATYCMDYSAPCSNFTMIFLKVSLLRVFTYLLGSLHAAVSLLADSR